MIIVSDFSKTFTKSSMPTTWSVFAKSSILWEGYMHERDQLFEQYHSYELAWDVTETEEWFLRHAELFVKYELTEKQIERIVTDDNYFAPRDGVAEFLDEIQSEDISLYIVSSGISEIIAKWFKLRFDYVPDIIVANDLIIEDGKVVWVDKDSIICPLDKSIEFEFEQWEKDTILVGDALEDTQVISNYAKTIGFTDKVGVFDITLWKDASMSDILQYV